MAEHGAGGDACPVRARGRLDAPAVADLVGDRVTVLDLSAVDELSRDGLELVAALRDRGRIRVVGAGWAQVAGTLLAAPLGEVGRLGVLARGLIGGPAA